MTYHKMIKCGCCKTKGFMITGEGNPVPCPYCDGTGKRKELRPHPSHKMSKWRTEILAPCDTPRFYAVRHCARCKREEWKHSAGHFLHGLGNPCTQNLKFNLATSQKGDTMIIQWTRRKPGYYLSICGRFTLRRKSSSEMHSKVSRDHPWLLMEGDKMWRFHSLDFAKRNAQRIVETGKPIGATHDQNNSKEN